MGKLLTRRAVRLVSDCAILCSCIYSLHVESYITFSITGVLVRGQEVYPCTKPNRFKEIHKLLQPIELTPQFLKTRAIFVFGY